MIKRSAYLSIVALCVLAGGAAAGEPTPPSPPAEITATREGHGWIFADAHGMTLYTYAEDQKKPGASLCNGPCAKQWPPVPAAAETQAAAPWSTVKRDDGSYQWALGGMPLYTFANDPTPGATFGDGFNKVWRTAELLIPVPPQTRIVNTVLGRTLATSDGHTLYASKDAGDPKACRNECLTRWHPLLASPLTHPWDEWAAMPRGDGTFQWMHRGKLLYTYDGDVNAREVSGQGRGGWTAVVLQPQPPAPSWVKPKGTDAGELLGNAEGMTIYYYVKARGPACVAYKPDCVSPDWRPIQAAADAKPVGDWTILTLKDGPPQWAYKGNALYTYAKDYDSGDFKGIMFGGNRGLKVITRSGDPLQGVGGAGG